MQTFDTRTTALALLGLFIRQMDPAHANSSPETAVEAAHDLLDVAGRVLQRRQHDYHNSRGDDGLTQAERDAGYTAENVLGKAESDPTAMLPFVALHPGNDPLTVLAALHADGDVQAAIRTELQADPYQQGTPAEPWRTPMLQRIAEHYPGVSAEIAAYVLHPDRNQAAAAAGGQSLADELAGIDQGAVDRRVPGPYIPPDSQRPTDSDAAIIAPAIAAQERGREQFNLGDQGNGELPELAAAPQLEQDDAGHLQELPAGHIQELDPAEGGAIQQDDTGGHIQQDDAPGSIQQVDEDTQGAGNAPQQ